MTTVEEASEKLQSMGVEATESLERSIAGTNKDIQDAVTSFVVVGDALSELKQEQTDTHEEWVEATLQIIKKGIKVGRISRGFLKYSLLQPRMENSRNQLIEETRQDLFHKNPSYHGRRHGAQYAKAVASGRLKT